MGSNIIVIATLIFLLFSAVVLVLMLYTMKHTPPKIQAVPIHNIMTLPQDSPPVPYGGDTDSLGDIQDFINAKAEIIYNERAYTLDSDFYKIGRDFDCNLKISDKSVSRLQCAVEYHDNVFTLSDLNSTYGTYVNGKPAKEPIELHDGDEIRMGYAVMTFKRRNERKADDGGAENPSQPAE